MMRMCWPARTRAAMPRRAGIVTSSAMQGLLGAAQGMAAAVVGHRGRAPAAQEVRRRLPDLHAERPAGGEGIAGVGAPHRHGEVAVGAYRDRAEHVDLREAPEVVAALGGAGLDEAAALGGEAGDLEDIEHVVDVPLGELEGPYRPDQIAVTAEIELLPVEALVDGGGAAQK